MPTALHILKPGAASLAAEVIDRQQQAGDRVVVALLGDATAPPVPAGVETHRVPGDLSYAQLLELVFSADQVVTW